MEYRKYSKKYSVKNTKLLAADLYCRLLYSGKLETAKKIRNLVDFHDGNDEVLFYKLFDFVRFLKLPSPPYLFILRISSIMGES